MPQLFDDILAALDAAGVHDPAPVVQAIVRWREGEVKRMRAALDEQRKATADMMEDALLEVFKAGHAVVEAQRNHLGCMAEDDVLDAAMDTYDAAVEHLRQTRDAGTR